MTPPRARFFSFATILLITLAMLFGSDRLLAQSICSDSLVQDAEECDDGNLVPGDGCSASCRLEVCGNGVVDFGETCDDSGLLSFNDGCIGCQLSTCGNGIVEPGENCDGGAECDGECHLYPCTSDAQCSDGLFCNGAEICQFDACYPGTAVDCGDVTACTADFCQEWAAACRNIATGDTEAAAARDGRCQSLDDNLPNFGADGDCGSSDDPHGDGVCDAGDNCPSTYNPSQSDGDGDSTGNACDATACPSLFAYVAEESGRIRRVDLWSGQSTLNIPIPLSQLRGLEIDSLETTGWVAGSGRIHQFTLPGGPSTQLAQGLSGPWGLAYDAGSSRLYVTEETGGELSYIDAGSPVTVTGSLSSPRGVAMGSSSSVVLVAESGAGRLVQIDPFGDPTPVVKASGLSGPSGVAYDPLLDVAYVTEASGGRLKRVDLLSGSVTTVAAGLPSPVDVALDASGAFAYITDSSSRVRKVEIASGAVTIVASMPRPWGIHIGPNPPPRLSLPDAVTTSPGASVPIDVTLEGATGLGVLSVDLTIEWNDEVLTATTVAPGSLAGGCSLTDNLAVPGRAVISVFCTTPLSGSGSLVTVNFDVIGQKGEGTPLRLSSGILNEGTPSVCLDSGSLELPVSVDGRITYYRDAGTSSEPGTAAVPFVNVALNRVPYDPYLNAGTACDGTYSFPTISAGTDFEVFPYTYTTYAPAIDPFDASLNAQHVVGLISLTPNQRLAADVTGNGALSSFDSALIAQMSVELISQFPVETGYGGTWAFVPIPQSEPNQTVQPPVPSADINGAVRWTPLLEDAEDQDFLGVLFGDVSGNWAPPACLTGNKTGGGAESLKASAGAAKPTARVALPDLTGRPGGTIQVPVRVTGGSGLLSMYLDITWNPAILKWRSASAGASGASFSVTANGSEPGRARLALYSVAPLAADGDLVVLTFDVTGKARSRTALTIDEARINEGGFAADLTGGSVQIRSAVRRGGDAARRDHP